jgi:hypothetical protein
MSFLVIFLLLVILVPVFMFMAVAWNELKSRTAQTPGVILERARDNVMARPLSTQVSQDLKSAAPSYRAALFTPKTKKLRVSRVNPPPQPASSASGARRPRVS